MLILGLVPALGAAVYKGVLFSTTSQPAWSRARWMGAYVTNSALLLGTLELLLLASVMGSPAAAAELRLGAMLLLVLNLVALVLLLANLRGPLSEVHGARASVVMSAVVVLAGILVPLSLLAWGAPLGTLVAGLLILAGSFGVRSEIVRLPHLLNRQTR
jgi:hypothetical protein